MLSNMLHGDASDSGNNNSAQIGTSKSNAQAVALDDVRYYIQDEQEIKLLYDDFKKSNVAFGNSPFNELLTDNVRSIAEDKEGVMVNLPNKVIHFYFTRSRILETWDPLSLIKVGNEEISPSVKSFIDNYCFYEKTMHIDDNGDRVTLPHSDAKKTILVIGDSVAYGAALNDNETLASQLQEKYASVKFINASVPGSGANQNRLRLKRKLDLLKSDVIGVIYVHCTNDYASEEPPEKIVNEVVNIIKEHNVPYLSFVYQQYAYDTMPDMIREKSKEKLMEASNLKQRFFKSAQSLGCDTVDFSDIVFRYRDQVGNPLSGFSLYVDYCHISELGFKLIVDELQPSLDAQL
jgi:lysophospholipase L1-like esterase